MTRALLPITVSIVGVLLAGCSTGAAPTPITVHETPSAAAAPTPVIESATASPVAEPTAITIYVTPAPASTGPTVARPSTPTASPSASASPAVSPSAAPSSAPVAVTITHAVLKTWTDANGTAWYHIVVEVTNTGSGLASLNRTSESYTIDHKDGSLATSGKFSDVFPQVIAPGEHGYYVTSGTFDHGTNRSTIGRLDPSITIDTGAAAEPRFLVNHVTVRRNPSGTGLQVAGVVKNPSGQNASSGLVGVILLDRHGAILAGLIDTTHIQTLHAGQTKSFITSDPGTPPLAPSQVGKVITIAFDANLF